MKTYEKLGAFYLGRMFDVDAGEATNELLLYDAKDLTTHAVCVGMTGSGKTGLCLSLLEEAAIDGVPAIAIDPKGDLGNLLLTFPSLRPQDFAPWVDPSEAARKGMTSEAYAADRAQVWKDGLADWDQDGERIARFRAAADVSIYTPGSNAGLQLSVLRSFAAPPAAVADDDEAMRDRITSAVSGLLALLGIDADPIRSREHILISSILDREWRAGRDLDIAGLIHAIQSPPFEKIGVMDLESFFSAKDRFGLAMSLNNLLASPSFAAWMEGEPLDVGRLLHDESGRPRISIISIAHLSESERMFLVTLLLNEVVSWMRTQSGTSSLRALLYMDEIFGFFPPTANPPSKQPMLTLLKQARAYGLGVMLATQNPVDLDYKGLSNTGTWFLGRLQTERDKRRIIDGLEGAAATAGGAFDARELDRMLSGLSSRVFLMNNVHDNAPALFQTRWALSYLRGPMTRREIQTLMDPRKASASSSVTPPAAPAPVRAAVAPVAPAAGFDTAPPAVDPDVTQLFHPPARSAGGGVVLYRPALIGVGRLHYVRVAAGVDEWKEIALLAPLDEEVPADPWEDADVLASTSPALETEPRPGARFGPLPADATRERSHASWSKKFVDHLYRTQSVTILRSRELRQYSGPAEDEREFRVRLRQLVQEQRDLAVEKLHKRYEPKIATMQDRIRRAEEKVERESAQARQAGLSTAVSLGATILGAMFGRKAASVGTVGRAGSTLRGAGRTARERGDIARAKENVESIQERLRELEAEFEEEVQEVQGKMTVEDLEFEEIVVSPRKSDLSVKRFGLVWLPFVLGGDGVATPAFEAQREHHDTLLSQFSQDRPTVTLRILARITPLSLALGLTACSTSVRVSDPPRTATEQFLMSQAAAEAIAQLSMEPLRGRRVFVDAQYFEASEQEFVIGEFRARMFQSGVQVMPERETAEIVVEVRTGGIGIDRSDFLLGIPSILLRAGTDNEDGITSIPLATPEVALAKNIDQRGIASVAYVAYWRETGEIVGTSGPMLGFTSREDWWFLGSGPNTVGDIPTVLPPEE